MTCAIRPWTKKQGIAVAHQTQFSGNDCVNVLVAKMCTPCSTVARPIAASASRVEK
eukprot:CAMPEP_0119072644 /NCGR_PEP_ID=MMETSP1178-20130426/58502_1 /TAXON_ID=33656 /ORGANISM="unid sp, Strain CCMP2000" /LENGTH=55 /DNA_ID=CAMNT_0007054669 /DNA_START=67 /DNA_END=234 /DNA_ORIENTATION=+